ncbi:HD domain-containing phosphohydrolase [Paludisphaera borealis]|uniref:Cyclic di-GMP phosphodiesterase response regulator RpfG n=1 Tax=Paludisphaera borealis TaxID=1387353 RepID=A0A1U7CID1_9BACT|nr:HD domain-containing phosphohydrolase [Paludisphaera borealis]APW58691.1 Cyclic di-GMP phosphodiesterase response regulator RpfG [Paludisphaera borealis]
MAIEGPNPTALRELARAFVLPPMLFAGLAAVFLGLIAHLVAVMARIDRSDTVIARTSLIQAILGDMQDWRRVDLDRSIAGVPDSFARQAIDVDRRWMIDAMRGRLTELLRVEEEEVVRSERNQAVRRSTWTIVCASLVASALLGLILATTARRQLVAVSRSYDHVLDDARRQAEAVRDREAILSSFYDNAPMMMGISEICGDDLLMISANAPTARPLGLTPDAMRGRLSSEVGITKEHNRRWIDAYRDSERTGRPIRFEYAYDHPGGRAWLSAVGCPLEGFPGRFTYIVQDDSERKQAEEALRESRERLRAALTASGTGTFRWDIRTGAVDSDENLDRLFGIPAGQEAGCVADFMDRIHPDDRDAVATAVDRSAQRGEDICVEFRVVWPDGTVHWLADKGKTFVDAAGKPSYMAGACVDVTAHRVAEEEIRGLNARLELRLARLAALRRIDAAITAGLDLRQTLGVVLDEVAAQLGVDAADVLMHDTQARTLVRAAEMGFQTPGMSERPMPLDRSVPGWVALEGRRLDVADLSCSTLTHACAEGLVEEGFVAYHALPLLANGQVRGVLEVFHRSPLDADADWLEYLETLAGQAAIAIDNSSLLDGLRRSNAELAAAYDATIEGWARALDLRDQETEGHSRRVTEITVRLARAMGVGEAELVHLRRGALLHDIGKVGIPDRVLLKPGPLDDEEWEVMRRHPAYAYEMLFPITFLRPALEIPYGHHERWDGSGYPLGLKGEEIPLSARIFAAVDVWDALGNDRPYRAAWPRDRVRDHIASLAGTHLDPRVVESFLAMIDEQAHCDAVGAEHVISEGETPAWARHPLAAAFPAQSQEISGRSEVGWRMQEA